VGGDAVTPQVVARAEERKNAALHELDDAKEQIGALQQEALLIAAKAAEAEALQAAAESRARVAEETAEKNARKAIADAQAALRAAVSDRDEVYTHTQLEKQGVGKVEVM
jgi:hypothetical protein